MKKILTLLTGIVFLVTILIAGACSPAGNNANSKDSKRVKIYLKVIEEDGGKHLEMYDSKKPGKVVVDSLVTIVEPGITVVWKLKKPSGIKKINKIVSKGASNIFQEDAKKRFLSKGFILRIPDDAKAGEKAKYDIVFEDKEDEKEWTIDPYLRIPDLDQ